MLDIENKKKYQILKSVFFACLFLIGLLLTVKISAHQYDGIYLDPNYYFHLHALKEIRIVLLSLYKILYFFLNDLFF